MQMGMLYESLSDRPGVNVEQVVCHFEDHVPNVSRMTEVWARLTECHPILRSFCNWRNGQEPQLVAVEKAEIRISVQQFAEVPGLSRADQLARWLKVDRNSGVDIEAPPPWRLNLLVWGERSFSLVWTFHHLFLDGPSFAMLLQKALRSYLGQSDALESNFGELVAPTQADHVQAISHRRADPEATAASRHFFRTMFEGAFVPAGEGWSGALPPSVVEAEAERISTGAGMQMHCTHVSARTLELLNCLCKDTDTTLSTLVQAAWGLVLSRWTGRSDVVLGIIRSGRHLLPGAEQVIGSLINLVPVRLSISGGQSLAQWLVGVRELMLGLRPHEHVALSEVRQWCDFSPDADLHGCTVLFEPRPLHRRMEDAVMSGVRVELHEQGSSELSLLAYVDDGIDLRLEFDADRISSDTAQRLLSSALSLLESMAMASPDTPLAALRALEDEDVAALARWGVPDHPVENAQACVATRFERMARLTPNARAVSDAEGRECLSYEQLDRAADRLAGWIVAKGIGPGDYIALCLPRGTGFVTAMLAVMKSGAAWVPVDPAYPADLMNHMVSDSHARLLITDRSVRPSIDGLETVTIEDIDSPHGASHSTVAASQWPVDRPAYVIYTSGSTGKPKGVVVGHQALACHAQAVIGSYGLQPSDRVLQFSALSFDVSIEEVVPTLVSGAELVLRNSEAAGSVSALIHLVRARQLTVLNLPTAFWHACVEQMHLSELALPESVRLLIVGGEKASRAVLEQWRRIQPGLRWINAYGPTEATISSTFHELPAYSPLAPGQDVPIGRPLGHARAVVLAIDGSLAPPGARGELCIGGPGLANGYLGLEVATKERFISPGLAQDPMLRQWGLHRLYRTGDDAQWDENGLLRFLGRRDREVKVRGFRMDLRAIEHTIEQVAGVAECVVRVDRADDVAARLLAWVMPEPGAALTESMLRTELANALPLYMRPSVKLVSMWPTTPGGKIDVQHLPAHEPTPGSHAAQRDMPEDVARMAGLFASVLQRLSVGAGDSFFDLGGNSLLAVSLIAAVERELAVPLSVGMLKAHPTPEGLCAAIRDGRAHAGPQFLVVIQAGEEGIPVYGVHSLGHRERFYRPLAARLGPAQPVFGLTTGYTHLHENELTIEQLAGLYCADIQKHRPSGPVMLAAVSMCAYVAYELARQLTDAGRDVVCLVLFDSEGPDGRPSLQSKAQILALHLRQLRKKGSRYLLERLVTRLTETGGVGSRIGLQLARRLNMVQSQSFDHPADHTFVHNLSLAVDRYKPGQYHGRMVVFYPEDEPFFDLPEAVRTGLGWGRYGVGGIDLMSVPGTHLSMLAEPHVGQMAQKLSPLLLPSGTGAGSATAAPDA